MQLIYSSILAVCQNKYTIKQYIQIIAKLTGSVISTCTTIPSHLYYKWVIGKFAKGRKGEEWKHIQPKIRSKDLSTSL